MKFLDADNWLTEKLSWEVQALLGGTGASVTSTPSLTLRELGAFHRKPSCRPTLRPWASQVQGSNGFKS